MIDLDVLGGFWLLVVRDAFIGTAALFGAFYIAYLVIDVLVSALAGEVPNE